MDGLWGKDAGGVFCASGEGVTPLVVVVVDEGAGCGGLFALCFCVGCVGDRCRQVRRKGSMSRLHATKALLHTNPRVVHMQAE